MSGGSRFDLPADLPHGEAVLWEGQPTWRAIARRVMHVRTLTLYFGALAVVRAAGLLSGGARVEHALGAVGIIMGLGVAATGLLTAYAYLSGRTTIYVLTNRRLIMRCGVALPKWVNIPLRHVESAGLRVYADGTGDMPLQLGTQDRLAYLALWPHVRPWYFSPAQPMLREIAAPETVARLLADALVATAGDQAAPAMRPAPSDVRVPAHAVAA